MNRREFGKMIAGTGVAAAVPVSGIAGAAAASAQRSKYIFAVALAHSRVDVSAEMITDTFSIRPTTARRLLSKLVKNGVVDAPNPHGIARLAEPLQRIVPQVVEYNPAGGYIVKGRLDEMAAKAREAARKMLETDSDLPTQPIIDDFSRNTSPDIDHDDAAEIEHAPADPTLPKADRAVS